MSLLNSELLWLLPLIGVPILVHLLIRQRVPRVQWAAMTFLMRALRKNRRRLLMETLLLLVVRTAIVAAVVFVVLRPVARAGWHWLSGQRQRTLSVVVLDDSASMAASDGVRSRFDRAVSRIEQYLDTLPAGSDVAVILAANPPIDLIRQPTRDLGYVRQALARLAPRDSQAAIDESLTRAASKLTNETTPNREILVASDMQGKEWQEGNTARQQALLAAREAASVFLLTVPATPAADVGVADLSISGGPEGLVPSLAGNQWPTTISLAMTALNHKEDAVTNVDLFVDGQKVTRRQVVVPPDRVAITAFEHRFNSPGEHTITARCDNDLYARNNQRSMVVRVRDRIKVLLIDGRAGTDPAMSAGGFLQAALWPTDPQDPETASLFDILKVTTGGLESLQISSFPLIILADVPALPTAALGGIKTAVREGAGLLVIAGAQINPSNFAAMFAESGSGLLPVQLGPPIDLPPTDQPAGLVLAEPLVPALAAFDDPTLMKSLSQAAFRTLRPVAGTQGKSVQSWAGFTKGGTALVANTYGRGRVVYFGSPADRQGGEFPLSPAFVPFFQQLAFHLTFGQDIGAVDAGSPLEWRVTSTTEVTLTYPDGTSTSADSMVIEDATSGQSSVMLSAADHAGLYTLTSRDSDNTPRQAKKAVNLPAEEFNPAMPTVADLQDKALPAVVRLIGPDESIHAALMAAKRGAELSTAGLVVLLGLLLTELLLVRLFAPRQVDAEGLLKKAMRL